MKAMRLIVFLIVSDCFVIVINVWVMLCFCAGNDTSDSDSNAQTTATNVGEKKTVKERKKRKIKDDTEQPIYPCEECTQCFTTQADLKVLTFVFTYNVEFLF